MSTNTGQWLREVRRKKGMTQTEVFERMSIREDGIRHRVSVTQMEGGKWVPTPSKLAALVYGYRLSSEERTELERLLLDAEAQRKINQSEGIDHAAAVKTTRGMDEAMVITRLLQMPRETRERVVKTIQAFDASK